MEPEYETERGWEATTPPGGAAQAWQRQGVVRPPQPLPRALLPPTYTSRPETIGGSAFFPDRLHYTTTLHCQQTSWSEIPLSSTESRSGMSIADQLRRSL
jgi:hypothetical protein